MSWQLATKAVYKSLNDEDEYPIRSVNRFKTDPRVKTGPRFDHRETWAIFSFGTRRSHHGPALFRRDVN
jgi:hypothetical protein